MTTGAHLSEPGGDRDPSRPNVGPFEPPQSEPVIPPQSELPAVPPVPEPAPFPPVPEPAPFPPVPPWRPPEPRYQKEASGDLVRGVLERARLKRGVGMAWPRVSGPAGVSVGGGGFGGAVGGGSGPAGLRGFGACDSGGGDCRCPGVCGRRFGWVWIRS